MPQHRLTLSVTIASGGTKTPEFEVTDGFVLCGIHKPATLTGTTLTFEAASATGGTFGQVIDETGAAISKTVSTSAAQYIEIPPTQMAGCQFMKLVSGSTEGADRTFVLVFRRID